MSANIFNPELLAIARDQAVKAAGTPTSPVLTSVFDKGAFVDPAMAGAADMAMGGSAGGVPPPPVDPMAGPIAGPMPPMPEMGMGGESGLGPGSVEERLAKLEAGGGEAVVGADATKKPKVDVNTEIYHIKKMLAKLLNALGIQMDATDMLGDPAEDPEVPPGEAAQDPYSAASQTSSIGPIQPIEGASPGLAAAGGGGGGGAEPPKTAGYSGNGSAQPVPQTLRMSDRAAAMATVLRQATGAC